ncbi:MAG: hypothetical protein ACK40X_13370, partial [Armatimonadota bacterium]
TVIKAKAEIQFDENPPIVTNEIELTVDSQPPTSQVTQLASEQTRSTFEVQWQAQDDVSGISQSELWVNEERSDGRGRQRKDGSRMVEISDKVYTLFKARTGNQDLKAQIRGKFGYTYRFFAVSRDNVGNIEPFPEQPQAITKVGRAPQIPSGLRIVALPVQSEDEDPKTVFNFPENKWATWDPTANNGQGGYVLYPNDAVKFSEPEKVPGRAYWVRLNEATTPLVFGPMPDDTQPFTISLKKGWNLIGNPWLSDLIWDTNEIKVQVGNETKPLGNAQSIIEPYAWRWDGNNYQLVYELPNVDNKIPAWEGAWVFAWQDCNLIVPAPQGNRSRQGRMAREKPEGWFAKLVAQVEEAKGQGLFGIAPRTRLQISQPPSPPERQNEGKVQVLFLDKEGNPSIADIKAVMGQRQEWDVVVSWEAEQRTRGTRQVDEVVVTFDGVGYAPKDVSLWLVDTVTGRRLYM